MSCERKKGNLIWFHALLHSLSLYGGHQDREQNDWDRAHNKNSNLVGQMSSRIERGGYANVLEAL